MGVMTVVVLGLAALVLSMILTLLGIGVLIRHWQIGRKAPRSR